jgi:hypothetical protein
VFANHRAKAIMSGVTDPATLALLSHLLEDETIRQVAAPAALAEGVSGLKHRLIARLESHYLDELPSERSDGELPESRGPTP